MNANDFALDWTAGGLRVADEPFIYYQPSCLLGASPRSLSCLSKKRRGRAASVQGRKDGRIHSSDSSDGLPSPRDVVAIQDLQSPRQSFPLSQITYSDIEDKMTRKGQNIQRILQTLQRNCDSFDEPASHNLPKISASSTRPLRRRRDDEWIKHHDDDYDSSNAGEGKEPVVSENSSRSESKQDEKPMLALRSGEIKPMIISPALQTTTTANRTTISAKSSLAKDDERPMEGARSGENKPTIPPPAARENLVQTRTGSKSAIATKSSPATEEEKPTVVSRSGEIKTTITPFVPQANLAQTETASRTTIRTKYSQLSGEEKPTVVSRVGEIKPTITTPIAQGNPLQTESVSRSPISKKSSLVNGDEKPTPVTHSSEIKPTITPPVLQANPAQKEVVSKTPTSEPYSSADEDEEPTPDADRRELKFAGTSPIPQPDPVWSNKISRSVVRLNVYPTNEDKKSMVISRSGEIKPTITAPILQVNPPQTETFSRTPPANKDSRDYQEAKKEYARIPKSPSTSYAEPSDASTAVPHHVRQATQSLAYWSPSSPRSRESSPISGVDRCSPIPAARKPGMRYTAVSPGPQNESWDNDRPRTAKSANLVQTEKLARSSSPLTSTPRSPNMSSSHGKSPLMQSYSALRKHDEEEEEEEEERWSTTAVKLPVQRQPLIATTGKQETSEIRGISPGNTGDSLSVAPRNNGQAKSEDKKTSQSSSITDDDTSGSEEHTQLKINGRSMSPHLPTPPMSSIATPRSANMLSNNGKPPLTQSSDAACEEEGEKKRTTTTTELPVQTQPLGATAGINGNKEDNEIPCYFNSAALQRRSDVDVSPYEIKHIDTASVAEAETSLMQVSPSVNQKVLELLDNWPVNGGKHDIKTTTEPDVLYAGRSASPIDHKFEDIIFYARTFNEDLQGYILEAKVKRQYAGCDFVAPSVAMTKTLPTSMVYSTATAPMPAPIPTNDGSDVDEKLENTEHRIIYASRCQS